MFAMAKIPLRAGSKRIKKKNIRSFRGKPIVGSIIDSALRSKLFKKSIVSTDREEIANLISDVGVEPPFIRPKEVSRSVKEVWNPS